jgi:hypothetical protein
VVVPTAPAVCLDAAEANAMSPPPFPEAVEASAALR